MKRPHGAVQKSICLLAGSIWATPPAFAASPTITGVELASPVAAESPQALGIKGNNSPPSVEGFYLTFPLSGQTHLSAPMSGLFDHSMFSPYEWDDVVVAYTGERGERRFGWNGDTTHPGFKNSGRTNFVINGHYIGSGSADLSSSFLGSDGHPGVDYPVPGGTPLYATADGKIGYPTSIPGVPNAFTFNIVAIDHGNDYVTYFLHCSTHPSRGNALVAEGATVLRGEVVAYSGDAGSPGNPHLHLEIHLSGTPVDPYGWSSPGPDPYIRSNADLWNLTRPKLLVSFSGSELTLSWPKAAVGFVLEQTLTLPAIAWTPGPQPVIIGEQNVVTITPEGRTEFYRLRK
jgi:murein DD-endopeptidase MepM/ murein hydrolase activator NlpD